MYKHAIAFRAGGEVLDDRAFRAYLHKPMKFTCPHCLAPVNRRCRDLKGNIVYYHSKRVKASKKR